MKKHRLLVILVVLLLVASLGATTAQAGSGFNQYGYNYGARIFVGTGNSWCQVAYKTTESACEAIMGEFSGDRLVMRWSKAWDDARFNGADWTTDAWVDNEWNGMFPDGSGWTEHFKAIWVGPCNGALAATNPNFRPGGSCIWDEFETLMDQGMSPDGFYRNSPVVTPNGYGAP